MDSKAIKLINMILRQESGYANVSGDLGGETYRGITRKNFPKWDGWKIVDENKPLKNRQIIENEELENNVMDFYYDNFYTPMKIDKVEDMLISGHLLCHGVNAGIKTSVKLLQKAVNNVYNVLKYTNGAKANEVAREFIEQRNQYYRNLVSKNPSQRKFLNGWLNRVKNTTSECS